MNAARLYVQAAGKAKANAGQLAKEDKQAFLDQYEQPNREKAITLFLELAAATKEKKDYTDAIGLYNTVLKIDPKNATAVAGIKAVQDEMKTAQANPGNGSQGGNSDQQIQQQKPWQDYKSSYNGWNTWTPSGGGYGYTKY
jgi:cytochrome c-type biogenesis protein CcmH/NrfG